MFDQGGHIVLARDGVAVVVKTPDNQIPQIVYWGKNLFSELNNNLNNSIAAAKSTHSEGDAHLKNAGHSGTRSGGIVGSAHNNQLLEQTLTSLDAITSRQTPPATIDTAWRVSLLPSSHEGWLGRPALRASYSSVSADNENSSSNRKIVAAPVWLHPTRVSTVQTNAYSLTATVEDAEAQCSVTVEISIAQGGLITVTTSATNVAAEHQQHSIDVSWLDSVLPIPRQFTHMLTFSGHWAHEKAPSYSLIPRGATTRTSYQGKPGHDSAWATVLSNGVARNLSGEVVACHVAFSGDVTYRVDRMSAHPTVFGGGEALGPGEIILNPGQTYRGPQVCFAWSDHGLDGISERFHSYVRTMPGRVNPLDKPRPFTLNTWEAVYFDHDDLTLARLADKAACLGVERFVIDDGWFHLRRNDSRGLGDWWVDLEVWPNGLDGIARHVHELGMEFGLWFEPEMVNPDSDVFRAHPDWVLSSPAGMPTREDVSYRNQYVLDIANPDAWEYIRRAMDTLISQLGIDYIKWDHNRYLTEAEHAGRYGVHEQTLAAYQLINRLKSDHPGLEIESCSSGGGRTDLGIIRYTDRVWGSDSNDPRDRVDIQRWTELLLPPEIIGAHVGPSPAHSTGRATDLSYRAAVSLMGCSGFEWNILQCNEQEDEQLRRFVALYKELRGLLHTGRVSHADLTDPALSARGVTDEKATHAVWVVATTDVLGDSNAEVLRIPNLNDSQTYRVTIRRDLGEPRWGWVIPQWMSKAQSENGFTVSGLLLRTVGLQLPTLAPQQAMVMEISAISE